MIKGTKRPLIKDINLIQNNKNVLNIDIPVSIHNRFDIEVIDINTNKIRQKAQAENIICDNLWDRILTPNTYFTHIHYGTGSGTPDSSDTSLFTFLRAKEFDAWDSPYSVLSVSAKDGIAYLRRRYQIKPSEEVGALLTEIGIGYSTSNNSLCTHAMLKDMNNMPISIHKKSTDVINIYATIFAHFNKDGYDLGFIRLLPNAVKKSDYAVSDNFIGYLLGFYSTVYGAEPPIYLVPLSKTNWWSSTTRKNRSTNFNKSNKTIKLIYDRFDINDFNMDIKYLAFFNYYSQSRLSSPSLLIEVGGSWYPKTTIIKEAVGTGDGTTKLFNTKHDCPKNAKVYINNILQSTGVEVKELPKNFNYITPYLKYINRSQSTINNIIPSLYNKTINVDTVTSSTGKSIEGLFENVLYQQTGIKSFTNNSPTDGSVEVSNNLIDWVNITSPVPIEYQFYRFWKITIKQGTDMELRKFVPTEDSGYNIHFETAPDVGDVIHIDYDTPTIAKDENHVFDFEITFQLGEHTPV